MDFVKYEKAAVSTARWTIGLLRPNGFEGCSNAILGFYKAPIGLLRTGHPREADQVLRILENRFFRDGDFHAMEGDPTPPSGRSYRNAWISWGAHELGAYHLSRPALDRLEAGLHPEHGGSADNDKTETSRRIYPAGGTAMVVIALLSAGRLDPALRAGRFLQHLYEEQTLDADRILLVRDADGVAIDPQRRSDTSDSQSLVFDMNKPDQICWIFGLSVRAFAMLYRATGDVKWLTTSERVRGWLERAHPSLYATVTNGKVAWGAAEMYGATGQVEWLTLAKKIGDWLLSQQGDDGIWVRRPHFASSAVQPVAVSLDTSVERMFYMVDIPRALSLVSHTGNQP